MKNKVVNSTIGTISKDLKLSMKTISEVSNTVTTMKAASDAISIIRLQHFLLSKN